MICSSCGREIADESKFCQYCGKEVTVVEAEVKDGNTAPAQAKCWQVFNTIGWILGIVSVSTCWIPFFIGVIAGVPGIVFSCLGRKCNKPEAANRSKLGLILSIVGTIVSIVVYILFIVLIVSAAYASKAPRV